MPITKLTIEDLLQLQDSMPVLDVRSPAEHVHAHIPGALSFPIFSNEERKLIGTAYKQESREKAIKIGLDSFGKNMVRLVEEAEKIVAETKNASRELVLHCWRGGMRSAAMAWLLDLYGFKVYLLNGGYKTYRGWVLKQFEKNYPLFVLGGCTGGNKTGVIHELLKKQEPAIDLEGLASHKGSAFGGLGLPDQPSQEQFENLLALELYKQSTHHENKPIWVEAESQRIGNLNIPLTFYKNMRSEPLFFLDIPFQQRLAHISMHYGKFEKEKLINATVRIKKKLGGLETKNAVNALLEDDVTSCFSILLNYYDRLYLKSTQNTEEGQRTVTTISSDSIDAKLNTEKLIQHVNSRKF
jgi:tRNA 2-selenouridine synthase